MDPLSRPTEPGARVRHNLQEAPGQQNAERFNADSELDWQFTRTRELLAELRDSL